MHAGDSLRRTQTGDLRSLSPPCRDPPPSSVDTAPPPAFVIG